jgi:hypothetical protein
MNCLVQRGVHPKFGGCIITKSPYQEKFVRLAKERIPWQHRVWWKEDLTWMFDPAWAKTVEEILTECFGQAFKIQDNLFPQYVLKDFMTGAAKFPSDFPPWKGGRPGGGLTPFEKKQLMVVEEEPEGDPPAERRRNRMIDL